MSRITTEAWRGEGSSGEADGKMMALFLITLKTIVQKRCLGVDSLTQYPRS